MNWKIKVNNQAKEDIEFFKKHNKILFEKCLLLLREIVKNPEEGIGKPEKLRYFGDNIWSRRVNIEHRIVYQIDYKNKEIFIISSKFHYKK